MTAEREEVKAALQSIVDAADKTIAVNWAVMGATNCIKGIEIGISDDTIHAFIIRILGNTTHWRGPEATKSRKILKDFVKNH